MKYAGLARAALICLLAISASGVQAQEEIQDLADKWAEAYNQHDKAALGALYTEDARLMMHGEATIVGRENIEEFWEGDFEIGSPLTLLNITHSVAGVDMMLVHGDYEVVDREDGFRMGGGRFAHIWILGDDGVWRLDRDLWNQPHTPVE